MIQNRSRRLIVSLLALLCVSLAVVLYPAFFPARNRPSHGLQTTQQGLEYLAAWDRLARLTGVSPSPERVEQELEQRSKSRVPVEFRLLVPPGTPYKTVHGKTPVVRVTSINSTVVWRFDGSEQKVGK